MPRFLLWPTCSDVGVREPRAPTAQPRGSHQPFDPHSSNSRGGEAERDRKERRRQVRSLPTRGDPREERRGEEEAEAVMLRGGGAARAAAKPSPPTPSRRARATAAAAAPESENASLLEDPVVPSVEETSFTFEFKPGSKRAKKVMPPAEAHRGEETSREGLLNKPDVVHAKTPAVAEERTKEVEFTHCAPGVVARLMGLDTVPRPKKALARCQSDIQSNMQRQLSGRVQEVVRISSEDQPCNSSVDELPELKDVFEVTEMENMAMRMALQSGNEKPRPRSNEADLEFVRQKFLDAKRLSTDEGHRNSKEFSEALEILHSKKDVFLEILQERSSVLSGFPGHILGHSGLQCSSHTSNASATQLFEQHNLRRTEAERSRRFHVANEFEDPLPSMQLKETSAVPLEHLAPNGSKSKTSGQRSRIVVLKPNLRKKSLTPVLSSQETSQFGQWSRTQSLKPPCRSMYRQDVMHSMAPENVQVLEPEGDTPEQKVRKQTPKRRSRRKPSEEECYLAIGSEWGKVASISHDETLPVSSSTRSAGSSVSRKARKHLSERWQVACQSNAEISIPADTRTLGEMLELSDRDVTKVITHKISSDPNVSRDKVQEMPLPACPLGISSKDGWKTAIYREDDSRRDLSRKFPRSKSLPASSTAGANLPGGRQSASSSNLPILKDILNTPTDESGIGHVRKSSATRKAKQKNGRAIFQAGKENMLPEKEIHVTSEKARHSICISDLSRTSSIYNEHPSDVISKGVHQTSDSAVLHDDEQNFKGHIGWTEKKLATLLPETKEVTTIPNQDDISLKKGRSESLEIDIAEVDHEVIQSAHIVSFESCECSSPTASLQQSSGEETAYSGIFKSINDGIQGLRVQLKMLKMGDQADTCGYDTDMFSSDECNDMGISNYQVTEEQLPIFKDEEDRDFTYVQDMLGTACDFPVYPQDWQVSSDVFLWLEHRYSKLLLWSKSDRKLLFDLVNSILADMTAPGSSLHSKTMMKCWPEMDRRKLAENVWQTVLIRRNHEPFDLDSVEALPLDHHSELEAIGTEIIKMIHENILEESVAKIV